MQAAASTIGGSSRLAQGAAPLKTTSAVSRAPRAARFARTGEKCGSNALYLDAPGEQCATGPAGAGALHSPPARRAAPPVPMPLPAARCSAQPGCAGAHQVGRGQRE